MGLLSNASRKRLVNLLQVLEHSGKERITSKDLAGIMAVKDTLIRYDLSKIEFGRGVSNGYDVFLLKEAVKKALGIDEKLSEKKCCVVGLGRLGAALLDDGIFAGSGFRVVAGFDSSVNRVEMLRSTFELYPANRIETVVVQQKIMFAILCCPDVEVQKMTDRLVKAGVKGVVNYTTCIPVVPESVKLENISPITALLNM